MKLYTVRRDTENAETVVCIHGLLGASRNLFRLTESIHKAGFSTLAYDQRGHGHSPHGTPESYTIQQLALDAIEVLNENKISRAHFVGHSLGGRVSLQVTALAPERVQSLTLLDVGAKTSKTALDEIRAIVEPMPDFFSTRADVENFLNRYTTPALKLFVQSNIREKEGKWTWVFDLHGIKNTLFSSIDADYTDAFKKIQCPILLVRGENSHHITVNELEALLKLNSNARSSTVPNAGHWVHADNFEGTSNAVITFLKEVQKK